MADSLLDNPAIAGPFRMPRLPVTGVLKRVGAFLVDWIIVIATLHLLARGLEQLWWGIGEWAPYVTGGLAFLYFALLNGPAGKGRTVGKMLFEIRVTDLDGGVPALRQSVLRTAVLMPIFVLAPLFESFTLQSTSYTVRWAAMTIPFFAFVAMAIATLLAVGFNPFRQGLHDFFSGTLVRNGSAAEGDEMTFEEMQERVGNDWLKFHRQPIYSGGISFAAFFLALIVMAWPRDRHPLAVALLNLDRNPSFGQTSIAIAFTKERILQGFGQDQLPMTLLNDDSTTGTTTVYVTAVRQGGWDRRFLEEGDRANVFASMDDLYKNVLHGIPETLEEETNEMMKLIVEPWSTDNIRVVYCFVSTIHLTPYPAPLQRFEETLVEKTYPPLGMSNMN